MPPFDMHLYFVLESLNENDYLESLRERGWDPWDVNQIHAALVSDTKMYVTDLDHMTHWDKDIGYIVPDEEITRLDIANRAMDYERCRIYRDILGRLIIHTTDHALPGKKDLTAEIE